MTTHITYETAKRLKEFLGDSAPEPIAGDYTYCLYDTPPFIYEVNNLENWPPHIGEEVKKYPAYQLHDLLSKQFCEAFLDMLEKKKGWCPVDGNDELSQELAYKYFFGGLPAVEAELIKMMEGK